MNSIQKKILYINIMMFIMLISGVTIALIGLFQDDIDTIHTIIMESIAAPLVVGTISMLGMELKHYMNIRKTQENKGDK